MTSALECLQKAQGKTQERFKQIEDFELENISTDLGQAIVNSFNALGHNQKLSAGQNPSVLQIISSNGQRVLISTQDLPRCWAVIPYAIAIQPYISALKDLKQALKGHIGGSNAATEFWQKFDKAKKNKHQAEIDTFLNDRYGVDKDSISRFNRFLIDMDWSGLTKKFDRTGADLARSASASQVDWLATAYDEHGRLILALADDIDLAAEIDKLIIETRKLKKGGENILFYGAPGTGKSYKMKDKTHKSLNVTTVFHSDMQNSDFIGALKPAVNGKDVTYLFSPGPFAKALRDAYKHPDQNVYLVIEELNRAPAMAVFGELFQLLDRKDNGESVYGVSFPSEEFQAWLNKETNMAHEEIRLPSNFSIYASINSADQGVYPLDTAFRRRWHQEYIHIDWNDTKIADRTIIIIKADGSVANLSWKALGGAINNELEDQYPEDRLLGQWWINNRDIENSNGLVPNKLLNYLWDDLLRHDDETKKKIFKPEIQRFGKLIEQNNGSDPKQIFSDNFLEKIVAQDD